MRIRQRAYLAVTSDLLSPAVMADRLGMRADRESWRGSRSVDPPRPACHRWVLDAEPDQPVDVALASLLERITPIEAALRRLVSAPETSGGIQVVRQFGHPEGVDEVTTDVGSLQKLEGHHQLLGFHLDLATLTRLVDLGLTLDVDEYG